MGRNTVGKGVIARYEQFLLFLQCFQKVCFTGASKAVIVWEGVKVPIAANGKGVCLQNTSKPHSYHLKVIKNAIF